MCSCVHARPRVLARTCAGGVVVCVCMHMSELRGYICEVCASADVGMCVYPDQVDGIVHENLCVCPRLQEWVNSRISISTLFQLVRWMKVTLVSKCML